MNVVSRGAPRILYIKVFTGLGEYYCPKKSCENICRKPSVAPERATQSLKNCPLSQHRLVLNPTSLKIKRNLGVWS